MFKRKKDLLPTIIASYFNSEISSNHSYNLRNRRNNRNHFRSNTKTGEKSIQNGGEILWQELPPYLKDLETLATFKKYYKSYLIELE